MKNKKIKKFNVGKELSKLLSKYARGNQEAWPLAEYHIDTIRGLEFDEEMFLKTKMKKHLEIDL